MILLFQRVSDGISIMAGYAVLSMFVASNGPQQESTNQWTLMHVRPHQRAGYSHHIRFTRSYARASRA